MRNNFKYMTNVLKNFILWPRSEMEILSLYDLILHRLSRSQFDKQYHLVGQAKELLNVTEMSK